MARVSVLCLMGTLLEICPRGNHRNDHISFYP
jgi:hypothetical protein